MGFLSLLVSALIVARTFGSAVRVRLPRAGDPIRLSCQRRTDIDSEGQSPAVCLAQSIGLGEGESRRNPKR